MQHISLLWRKTACYDPLETWLQENERRGQQMYVAIKSSCVLVMMKTQSLKCWISIPLSCGCDGSRRLHCIQSMWKLQILYRDMLFQLHTCKSFTIYSMLSQLCCISHDDGHKGWHMLRTKKKNKKPYIFLYVYEMVIM